MGQEIFQVDAFTAKPFAGNPAAVCILSKPAAEDWMQHLANEMNLSETAFLVQEGDGFNLRWFTPAVEVELCGHATLASAHILWEQGFLSADRQARFYTRSGLLSAVRKESWIELDFPAEPERKIDIPEGLLKAFLGHLGSRWNMWEKIDLISSLNWNLPTSCVKWFRILLC